MELSAGPAPLYFQIQQKLRDRILSGDVVPGDNVPTEARLCSDFGVSRITVGKALDALVAERLIYRRQGVGTFVAPPPEPIKSVTLTGSLDEMLAPVKDLSRRLLAVRVIKPPHKVANVLRVSGKLHCSEALHFSGEGAYSFSRMFLPLPTAERIADRINEHEPTRIDLLAEVLGVPVVHADQTIVPVLAGSCIAEHLGITVQVPVLEIMRTYHRATGPPLGVVLAWYHPERYSYYIRLYPRAEAGGPRNNPSGQPRKGDSIERNL